MKSLKCDLCEFEARGETFAGWMEALKPHYVEKHSEFMKQQSERSEEEQKAEMQKWEIENRARFDTAPEENKLLYQCEECGFHYEDREWAEKCEAWCKEQHTCNIEITAHAQENRN